MVQTSLSTVDMSTCDINRFGDIGFLTVKFTEEELSPIKQEVAFIQQDFDRHFRYDMTSRLAGHLRREFSLQSSAKYLEELIRPHLQTFDNEFGYLSSVMTNSDRNELSLYETWVNYQSKYEFNPVHTHSGVYSFALWLSIPYTMDQEMGFNPGAWSNSPQAGCFAFHYLNSLGRLRTHLIPADKSYENTMVIFPATLPHSVNPFYSSDEYRISVSGNFVWNTK